jgi:hypothetical protein
MGSDVEGAFARLQGRLRRSESVDDPARAVVECTVVVIPSINFDQTLLERHAIDLPADQSTIRAGAYRAAVRLAASPDRPHE